MLANEARRYNVPFMNRTVGRQSKLIDKQDTNVKYGTVARLNPLNNMSFCLMA